MTSNLILYWGIIFAGAATAVAVAWQMRKSVALLIAALLIGGVLSNDMFYEDMSQIFANTRLDTVLSHGSTEAVKQGDAGTD